MNASVVDVAVAARTTIAAGHVCTLHQASRLPASVCYLDDGGQPILVRHGLESHAPDYGAVVVVGDGRTVTLSGRLRRVSANVEQLQEFLLQHAGPGPDAGSASLWRLEVDRVVVTGPRTSRTVSILDYGTVEPDLFAAHAEALLRHVETSHYDLLSAAAARELGEATSDLAAVSIVAMTATTLELNAITAEGAWQLVMQLDPPLQAPAELCERLWAKATT